MGRIIQEHERPFWARCRGGARRLLQNSPGLACPAAVHPHELKADVGSLWPPACQEHRRRMPSLTQMACPKRPTGPGRLLLVRPGVILYVHPLACDRIIQLRYGRGVPLCTGHL